MAIDQHLEWLEADGLGGFASGTVSGERTRRYHAVLLAATTPPTGRVVLVNGFDASVTTPAGRFAITSQRYVPDVVHPDGAGRIADFTHLPWPRWEFRLPDGTRLEQQVLVVHGRPATLVRWRLLEGDPATVLEVRPLLSGRDYHATHHENPQADLATRVLPGGATVWQPYPGVPAVHSTSTGAFEASPLWYRQFLYAAERGRGLDCVEDLANPGTFTYPLGRHAAHWMVSTDAVPPPAERPAEAERRREAERARRRAFASPLHLAADAYLVSRGSGRTIVAGYPWFTDWGRDTFISLPGLCLRTGRLDAARDILVEWSTAVSDGMLPNRFPDSGEAPEYNAVDASLWFVVAADALLEQATRTGFRITAADRRSLERAVTEIVAGFHRGTRHGIRADADGLLAAGEPGVQLTWMDAKVNGCVITPRIGKPVEVQALWVNALAVAARREPRWLAVRRAAEASFAARFWNDERGCLYDVVDADHVPGATEASIRPNQVLAVGGLPIPLLSGERARRVVDVVERHLLVPLGLRTLAPGEPGYAGRYGGGVESRDRAYHQGTAWPWLLYAFADACVRTRPPEQAARDVRALVERLGAGLSVAGIGHLPEVIDGDPPHAAGGCPWQAWSLATLLQLTDLAARLAPPQPAESLNHA